MACAFKALQSVLVAIAWRSVLCSAYPARGVPLKLTLGAYQGGAAVNALIPAKAGTWVTLGLYRLAIPGLSLATLVAALGVHSLAFWVFDALTYALLYLSGPRSVTGQINILGRSAAVCARFPLLAALIIAGAVVLLALLGRICWRKLAAFRQQIAAGGAILHTPRDYAVGAVLPTALSYVCRWGSTAIFMAAFGIPVTARSVFLAIAAQAVGGAVQMTPAGLGTNQVLEVIALRNYAPAGIVTAFSLAQTAILLAFTVLNGLAALLWAFGWSQTKAVLRERKGVGRDPRTHDA